MWKRLYLQFKYMYLCENGECLASTIDDSVIRCDEIRNAADSVSTNRSANIKSTVLRNFHNKKLRYKTDCYIMIALILIVLLFIIVIVCYHYAKYSLKIKNIFPC